MDATGGSIPMAIKGVGGSHIDKIGPQGDHISNGTVGGIDGTEW